MDTNLDDLSDCIGLESCVDLENDLEQELRSTPPKSAGGSGYGGGGRGNGGCWTKKKGKVKKEYPPPIPWLVRTQNLHSHMPWVMKRYYTSDGRLVIMEEKLKRREYYFLADRSDGRLTLRLVPLSDDDLDHAEDGEEVQEEVEKIKNGDQENFEENLENVEEKSVGLMDEGAVSAAVDGGEGGGGGGSVKWYSCDGSGSGGWRFGMAVSSMFTPVHT